MCRTPSLPPPWKSVSVSTATFSPAVNAAKNGGPSLPPDPPVSTWHLQTVIDFSLGDCIAIAFVMFFFVWLAFEIGCWFGSNDKVDLELTAQRWRHNCRSEEYEKDC